MASTVPVSPQATIEPASLGTLPPELKKMILQQLPNKTSLSNIIRASASFRALYRSNSEEIYTAITIRSLAERGFDVFADITVMEIYVLRQTWSIRDVEEAVGILYSTCQKHKATNATGSIKCPVNVCTLALGILHAACWNLPEAKVCGAALALRRMRRYEHQIEWWKTEYIYGHCNYWSITVGY